MSEALLFFVKYPLPGKVKTRLGSDTGHEKAALLYKSFVEDMLESLEQAGLRIKVFYDPFQPLEKYEAWLGKKEFSVQQGEDLGERMHNAFTSSFADGRTRAILTGSDLPGLDPLTVSSGFAQMEKSPACIGPADDGGYYLIGFRKDSFSGRVFRDMHWSTPDVYTETISRLEEQHIHPAILPSFSDVDTLADLRRLLNNPSAVLTCPRTCTTAQAILDTTLKTKG